MKRTSQDKNNTYDLKERLYQKGFNTKTMPSVKRPVNTSNKLLTATLNSFHSRKNRLEPIIYKPQSIVLPPQIQRAKSKQLKFKPIQTIDQQKLIQPPNQMARTASMKSRLRTREKQKQSPMPPMMSQQGFFGRQHQQMNRFEMQTANFNQSEMRRTKYLVDRISGKFSIDKRYIPGQKQIEQQQQMQTNINRKVHMPQINSSKRQGSRLDNYIYLVMRKVKNVQEFTYVVKDQTKDDPYDLKVVTYQKDIKGDEKRRKKTQKKREEEKKGQFEDKKSCKQYYTVSRNGICHYLNGKPIQFIQLSEWLNQRQTYDQIKSLKFFTKFRKWKTLKKWRFNVIRYKVLLSSRELESRLFILNPNLRRVLLDVRSNTFQMQTLRLVSFQNSKFSLNSQITYSIQSFRKLQEDNRKDLKMKIQQKSAICRAIVKKGYDECIKQLINSFVNKQGTEQQDKAQLKKPQTSSHKQAAYQQLGFKNNMNYSQRSILRKQCQRFLRFAYLIDFIVMQSLKNINNYSVRDMVMKFQTLMENTQPVPLMDLSQKIFNKMDPLFIVDVVPEFNDIQKDQIAVEEIPEFMPAPSGNSKIQDFNILVHVRLKVPKPKKLQDDQLTDYQQPDPQIEVFYPRQIVPNITNLWLQISPTKEQYFKQIVGTINEGIGAIQAFERWSRNSEMLKYVNVLQQWDSKVGDDWQNLQNNFLNPNDWLDKQYSQSFKRQIKVLLEKAYCLSNQYIKQKFHKFLMIFWQNQQIDLELFKHDKLANPGQSIQYAMDLLQYEKELFEKELPNAIQLGLLRLDTGNLSSMLETNPAQKLNDLYEMLPPWLQSLYKQLKEYLTKSKTALTGVTLNIDDFVKQSNSLKEITKKLPKIKQKVSLVSQVFGTLQTMKPIVLGTNAKDNKQWKATQTDLLQNLMILQNAIHSAQQGTERNLQRFAKDVTSNLLPALQQQIKRIDRLVQDKKFLTNQISMDEAMNELQGIKQQIKKVEQDSNRYLNYQTTLNLNRSQFDDLESSVQSLVHNFTMRFQMWKSLKQWKQFTGSWINGQFNQINTEEIKSKSQKYNKSANKCTKALPPNPILDQLKKLLSTFKNTMPIVLALRNPHLEQYHWNKIKKIVKKEFVIDEDFTLKDLIQLDFEEHQEEIIDISNQARQEASLKQQIEQNKQKWQKLQFKATAYKPQHPKNKDVYVLDQVEDLYTILDELLANFTNILGNRYLKRFRSAAQQLHKSIFLAQQIIDDWLIVQKNWQYLYNIFSSSQIKNKLKEQNALFEQVDKAFKNHMKAVSRSKLVYKNLGEAEKWRKHKDVLANIQKALEDYLEDKRSDFPRFYFISNDELIEILAKATQQQAIQKNIKKCFEAIQCLNFHQQSSKTIIGVSSLQGQKLFFNPKVVPIKGQVQNWLSNLQFVLDQYLKKAVNKGYSDYYEASRIEFVCSHHGQVVLTVCQMIWTFHTQAYFDSLAETPTALQHHYKQIVKQLSVLTQTIRQEIPQIERKILVALITQDVHNRDIVEMLNVQQIFAKTDFQWQQQLRLYPGNIEEQDSFVVARQVNSEIKYGYEYLGVPTRLVITPLTDRCWMTITGAINIKLGAAPAGPAGTGKTQSTKDLAKGLGMLCVVYNCSQQIQYKMMGRLFTGLAQQGAWSCLDQFNRIDIEVLSVVAQQLLTIRVNQLKGQNKFFFVDRMITMKQNYGVFITMNPGYAGRTQLPDNLKVLFRSVSMMIPEYRLIAQIMLFAEGFENAKPLSKKMTQLYKLSSEQLSQQDHYDFGMRAVKSVLVMAGKLKRAQKELNEDSILIRAMRDANIPKFLKDDLPLFEALISDLFPKAEINQVDYGDVKIQIQKSMEALGLEIVDKLTKKVLQLFQTFNVRFGVMLVGHTTSGKTTCFKILQHVLTTLRAEDHPNPLYQSVKTQILNPKSIKMGELYGQVNPFTQEWQDGLASSIMRMAASEQGKQNTWVVFDGPVDSLWIQNMNTVLDDNMMLCLANGQRVKLRKQMHMLFEVMDLKSASPATVSRCGMVYMIYQDMGWKPYVMSWLGRSFNSPPNSQDNVPILSPQLKNYLYTNLFEKCVDPALHFIRTKLFQPIKTCDMQLLISLCNLMEILLRQEQGFKIRQKTQYKKRFLNYSFCFAFIWSLCVTVDHSCQEAISNLCRDLLQSIIFPNNDLVQSFFLDTSQPSFKHWNQRLVDFVYQKQKSFHQIKVETLDSLRYCHVINLLTINFKRVFVTGSSGTGKSLYLSKLPMPPLTLTSTTSAYQLQISIQNRLWGIKKTLLVPKSGSIAIISIDDVNMPQKQEQGAQPPIEVLRMIVDKMGLWDRKQRFWKSIQGTTLVCAGSIGRNELTPRFIRHFNMLCLPDPDNISLVRIFKSILQGFLQSHNFLDPVKKSSDYAITGTIQIYERIRKQKLPIPSKFHYTFNLRDLSKVFQGLLQVKPNVIQQVTTFSKLWLHEVTRVFSDRLINQQDRQWFNQLTYDILQRIWKMRVSKQDMQNSKIMFGDLLNLDSGSRDYKQIEKIDTLIKVLDNKLDDYNDEHPSKMPLVFFQDAIQHCVRICRVLRLPRGNCLLIGVGGCGKQSITKLCSYMNEYLTLQVQITKGFNIDIFREFIKQMMKKASNQNKYLTFLFTDNQIVSQNMLEDVNNILNSGEVPNLWQQQEKDQVVYSTKNYNSYLKRPEDPETIYRTFVQRVQERLHVILAMSPVGDALRIRCRKFPGLVDCCTLNWFSTWPSDALISVAKTLINQCQDFPIPSNLSREQTMQIIADMCKEVHISSEIQANVFEIALKRKVYTTPKSYLDMLKLFLLKLTQKRSEIIENRDRLAGGLDKLENASIKIAELEIMLHQLQPKLEEQSIILIKTLEEVQKDSKKAAQQQTMIKLQTDQVAQQTAEVQVLMEQAREILKQAQPQIEKANQMLKNIDRRQIETLRTIHSPSATVLCIMDTVSILLNGKALDWVAYKQMLLKIDQFIGRLQNYPKENVPEDRLIKLRKMLKTEQFKEERVRSAAAAIVGIWVWCKTVDLCAKLHKQTQPKRIKAQALQLQLNKVSAQLAKKQAILNEAKEHVAKLTQSARQMGIKQNQLQKELQLTKARKQRAAQLIVLTKDQAIRWKQSVVVLNHQIDNLLGDVFISVSAISYNGPFTGSYRKQMIQKWLTLVREKQIPNSQNYDINRTLGNPIVMREWQINGLPSDQVSQQNALFATQGYRYPLMIDPQLQASKWLKNILKNKNVKVIKFSNSNFQSEMKGCIKNGFPCLVMDVQLQIPPIMEQVLSKDIHTIDGLDMIKYGDQNITFDKKFQLFMCTNTPNPNYLPEIFIKVTVINFTVTQEGLEEQLLSSVVKEQREEIQNQRDQNIVKMAQYKKSLTQSQQNILRLLQNTSGDKILDDVELIKTLQTSKVASQEIDIKMVESEQLQIQIDKVRLEYVPVAQRGSVLFFVIKDLGLIDPMYQYSLQYIQRLFVNSIRTATASAQLQVRIKYLIENITKNIYINVTRGLFEQHKLIFSFLNASSINRRAKLLSNQLWSTFLRGAGLFDKNKRPMNPDKLYFSQLSWDLAFYLQLNFPHFSNLTSSIINKLNQWKEYAQKNDHINQAMPDQFNERLDFFEKMLIVKVLKSGKLMFQLAKYVEKYLGKFYLESPNATIKSLVDDSDFKTPIIFVLSPGADPTTNLLKFAQQTGYDQKINIISLGQGQGKIAQQLINNGKKMGTWVVLQNCHLARTWMPTLQIMVEANLSGDEQIDQNFRLYLTSMPATYFPVSILQNGIKITTQPPRGIKANLKRSWADITEKDLDQCQKRPEEYHKLLWGLTYFHAIIQQRRKFGPLGFNIRYQFNTSDLSTSKTVLNMLLKQQNIPWDALTYVIGHINYGGRVTDDLDRKCLMTILKRFFITDIIQQKKYKFAEEVTEYYIPQFSTLQNYLQHIENLPMNDPPSVFGMHYNANIAHQNQESDKIIATILSIQPRVASVGGGKTPDEIIYQMVGNLIKQLPQQMNIQKGNKQLFQIDENGLIPSLSTFLVQQIIRFNTLLKVIKLSLENLRKAIDGLTIMSSQLDSMFSSLLNNQVPKNWEKFAYPSLKPLGSWIIDLKFRIAFMADWLANGNPISYWMPGFFFPQGFITGLLQSHARQPDKLVPIDQLYLTFKFQQYDKQGCLVRPIQGIFINGLYLEGASWQRKKRKLIDSIPVNMQQSGTNLLHNARHQFCTYSDAGRERGEGRCVPVPGVQNFCACGTTVNDGAVYKLRTVNRSANKLRQ